MIIWLMVVCRLCFEVELTLNKKKVGLIVRSSGYLSLITAEKYTFPKRSVSENDQQTDVAPLCVLHMQTDKLSYRTSSLQKECIE